MTAEPGGGREACGTGPAAAGLSPLLPPDLSVNGRFATRPATGVDRAAAELLRALLLRAAAGPDTPAEIRLLLPGAAAPGALPEALAGLPGLQARCVPGPGPCRRGGGAGPVGHAWEQLCLPRAAGRGWLLSPCNTGPLLHRRQALILHDAQVWLEPGAYRPGFRRAYRLLLPLLARRVALLATVSDFSRRALERSGVAPPGKAVVIGNGSDHVDRIRADPGTLARHGLEPGGYILALGTRAPHKNLDMLARIARTRPPGARPLVIAGGSAPGVFASAEDGAENGAENGVEGPGLRRLGRVSDPEIKALYQGAALLAFPSRSEGFGLPPLEAMRCGTPVLSSTGGALPETCGPAARYADPDDPGAWARGIAALETAGAAERAALVAAGHARAARFTWAGVAERLCAALARQAR